MQLWGLPLPLHAACCTQSWFSFCLCFRSIPAVLLPVQPVERLCTCARSYAGQTILLTNKPHRVDRGQTLHRKSLMRWSCLNRIWPTATLNAKWILCRHLHYKAHSLLTSADTWCPHWRCASRPMPAFPAFNLQPTNHDWLDRETLRTSVSGWAWAFEGFFSVHSHRAKEPGRNFVQRGPDTVNLDATE